LRKPINYIITNLALADFARSIESGIMGISSNAAGYVFMGKKQCRMDAYIVSNLGTLIFIA